MKIIKAFIKIELLGILISSIIGFMNWYRDFPKRYKEFGLKHNPQWAFLKWCVGIMFVGWIFAISLFICLDS